MLCGPCRRIGGCGDRRMEQKGEREVATERISLEEAVRRLVEALRPSGNWEEIPLEGYKASYSAPETGEGGSAITITNTKSTGYTLPEAGGTGILRFLLAGGFLTGAACVIKYILWRNHRKEDEAARK